MLSSLIGAATAVWQVAILRRGPGAARGLRVPARTAIAGLLWTLASPRAAFGYLVAWMLLAVVALLAARRSSV